jgi:hypothetical protein
MAIKIQPKQIQKEMQGSLYLSGYLYPATNASNITVALTTASSTAGANGTPVPVQKAFTVVNDSQGFQTTANNNRLEVNATGTTTISGLTGTTDAVSGLVASVTPDPVVAGVTVGQLLVTAIGGIPALSKVTAVTTNSITFDTVSTSVVVGGALSTKTSPSETKLISLLGSEVYGRLTESAGAYTVKLYSVEAGIETAYTPTSPVTVDLTVPYVYSFENLPYDALVGGTAKFISQDVAGGARYVTEVLSVTGVNVLAARSQPIKAGTVAELYINGQIIDSLGGGTAAFTMTGTTTTWSSINAGYSLVTTDRVIARYEY